MWLQLLIPQTDKLRHGRFLVDVLEYFRINLSQLSVIDAAKISHFEILCHVHGYVPTVGLFQMDLFAFICHADPTKVRIGERQIEEGQVSLLDSTEGRVIPLAGEDSQDGSGSGDVDQENRSEDTDRAGQDEAVTIVVDEEFRAAAADKPKSKKKKRRAAGACGSDHPPKKLREDHGTSGDAGASTGRKSFAAHLGLLERSTLAVKVGVTAAATVPFVTYFVTPMPEREGGGNTDSVFGPNLHTQRPSERFVISSDSSYHYSTNVADAEVTSLVRSFVSPPPVMTTIVTTTSVAGASSAPVLGAGAEPVPHVHPSIFFSDSASIGTTGPDVACPSNLAGTKLSVDTFYVYQEMDSETLRQIYVPKWNVVNESVLDDPDVCRNMIDQLAPPGLFLASQERKKIERKCARHVNLLKEKDVEIANLKAQLSLKEVEATEERNSALEEEENALERKVATLESAATAKETELASLTAQTAKLTQDLSSLESSFDELSIKAASLESQRDGLVDQVSLLETTCSGLRDQVSGYELFKEQYEAIQDEQVKAFSDRMTRLDSKLMALALHLDEEFYPCFLTTIAGR
ncbi:hypothetical protein Tco_1289780 [Tanacetum coccineum]